MPEKQRFVSSVFPGRESLDVGARLWRLPALAALAAALLAAAMLLVDHLWLGSGSGLFVLYSGNVDTARSLLTVVATSTATLVALIFTILTIVIQLASRQYSPRALPVVYQDFGTQMTIGTLIGTFTYTLIVLQALRASGDGGGGEGGFVPGLSITVAFLLGLATVGVFVVYSNHIAHAVRVTAIIERIARRTVELIEELYPDRLSDGDGADPGADGRFGEPDAEWGRPDRTIRADEPGVLTDYDADGLLLIASERGWKLELLPAVGDHLPEGAPLLRIFGDARLGGEDRGEGSPDDLAGSDEAAEAVRRLVTLAPARTLEQDVSYGFRLLVDIAERSLSPAINDPTTAVQALDRMHDFLHRLARRRFPERVLRGTDGKVRLAVPVVPWAAYVELACAEIRHYGSDSIQVLRRMRAMLADLAEVAPTSRRGALDEQLALLDAAAAREFPEGRDRVSALEGDRQGLGGG